MHILLLTQIVPYPPDSGPKVKTFHVLSLPRRARSPSDACMLCASSGTAASAKAYDHTAPTFTLSHCGARAGKTFGRMLRVSAPVFPSLLTRDAKPDMYQLVRQLHQTQHFDIVHADQLTMAQFALGYRNSATLVFDAHNAVWAIVQRSQQIAPWFLRPLLELESRRIKRYEGELIRQFDHTLTVSAMDQQALLQTTSNSQSSWRSTKSNIPIRPAQDLDLRSKISIIPITIDCSTLQPVNRVNGSTEILTVGTLFYPPNADGVRWFLREIFPLVKTQTPAAHLTIIGPRPPKDILRSATENPQSVKITGYVPALLPYFECAAMMVVPVRAASGMRVRILEALARGIPVVTTTTGVEGIDAINGEHLLVADEPREFANAVVRLMRDRDLGERLGRNGRRLIEEKYESHVVLPELEKVYQSQGKK